MPNHVDRFYAAVSVLCGHGNIKQRLVAAFQDNLEQVEDDDLPIALKQSFIDLKANMSCVAPLNGEGPIRASVRKMSKLDADECAQMIFDLYTELVRYSDNAVDPLRTPGGEHHAVPPFLVKSV